MELIPVLSTIVLIATIMTFLLAIGAYILYKIRERKGIVSAPPQPAWVTAEFVTPVESPQSVRTKRYTTQPVFIESRPSAGQNNLKAQPGPFSGEPDKTEAKFMKYSSEGYVSPGEDKDSGAMKWK